MSRRLRPSAQSGWAGRARCSREPGEAQLAIVGKGDKPRNVLLPAELATALAAMRGTAPPKALVFPMTERRINYIVKAAAKRADINPAISAR